MKSLDWHEQRLTEKSLSDKLDQLQDLIKVAKLDLSFNHLKSVNCISQLTELEILNVRQNTLREVPLLPQNIQRLELCSNLIMTLPDLHELKYLWEITLNNNSIYDVPGNHLPSNLKRLHLRDNKIAKISNMFHLNCLKTLDLQSNDIKDFPTEHLPCNLETLNLSKNKIFKLSNLHHLKSLKELVLRKNNISDLPAGHLPCNLEKLDLSKNKILSISNISHVQSLKELQLDDNNISNIPAGHLPCHIKNLYLSHNKIANINNISDLKNLKTLDLQCNNIADLPAGHLPCNLIVLDVSENRMTIVSDLPEDIRQLYLHRNQIVIVENLPLSLAKITLSDNPVKEFRKGCFKTERLYNLITSEHMFSYKKSLSEKKKVYPDLKSPPTSVLTGYREVCLHFNIQPQELREKRAKQKVKPVLTNASCGLSSVGGLFQLKDIDVAVYVPNGAIKCGNVEILQSESTDENAVSYEYRISPHGLSFNQAILIRFPLKIKDQCNLYSLGVKYTNTDIHEEDEWFVYPLHNEESPEDVSFIIWGGYCYLFMKHLCGISVCKNCKSNTEDCAYHMNSHLFVRYLPEPRKAALLTTFSCTQKDKEEINELKKTMGEPVKEEFFVLYNCGGNVTVKVNYDEEKWQCRSNKNDLDVNKLLPHKDESKKQPQLEYFLKGKGQTDEDAEIEVAFGQNERGSTHLKWNPYWHPATWKSHMNQNGSTNIRAKRSEEEVVENSSPRLPTIEIVDELQPLCDHLQKDNDHLRQIALDIDAFTSNCIKPMQLLQAWFVMKYVQNYKTHELKQQNIWIELVGKLFQCGHFEEYKILMWIIQKQHLKEKLMSIITKIQDFPKLYSNCSKINLIDNTIEKMIEKESKTDIKMFFLLSEVVFENPLAYDTLVEFLEQTNQQEILGQIKLQKLPPCSHIYMLEEVVRRYKDCLVEKMTPEIFLELKGKKLIATKNKKEISPRGDIIVKDLQHVLSSENFSTFLSILCKFGQTYIMKNLKKLYLEFGGREEFCSVPDLVLGTIQKDLFAHTFDFSSRYDDFIHTLPKMGKFACSLHWTISGEQSHGTGFVVGSLQDVNQHSAPTRHFLLLTCNHLLCMGLENAINYKTSTAKFRFYKDDSDEAEEKEVKIQCIVISNDTLDYALLCLENNDELSTKLGGSESESFLGQYISDTILDPKHLSVLTLVGYPKTTEKKVDPSVSVYSLEHIKNEGKIPVPISHKDDKCVFYKCSSLHGASGSPCFDLNTKMLCSMHQGGAYVKGANLQPEYQYECGILLYHVVSDIKKQVLKGNHILTIEGFNILFPAFKSEGPSEMQLC